MAKNKVQYAEYEQVSDAKGELYWRRKSFLPPKGDASPPEPVLEGNPFFYSPGKGEIAVHDLEQFKIPGKPNLSLGEVVRDPKLSSRAKKRIVRKTFARWREEIYIERKKSETKNDGILEAARPALEKRMAPSTIITSVISCLLLILIVGTSSSLWVILADSSKTMSTIASALTNAFSEHSFFDACAHLDLYLFVLLFSYLPLYAIIAKSYRNRYNKTKHLLERAYRKLDRGALKRWTRARKYYLSRLSKPDLNFTPLLMSRVEEGNISLSALEDISTATLEQKAAFVRTNSVWIFIRKSLTVITLVLFMPVFIFAIAQAVFIFVIAQPLPGLASL